MTEWHDRPEPLSDLEALIRSAQDFVEPSDDLRPRVLEAVREVKQQRRAQQRLSNAAALVIALGMFLALIREEPRGGSVDQPGSGSRSPLLISDSVLNQNESPWEMVDSLTALRKQQALLFRLSL